MNEAAVAAFTEAGHHGDPYIRGSLDYLKKNKCPFQIKCYECDECKDQKMKSPADAGPSSDYGPGKGMCTIRVCASDPSMKGTFIVTALRHELAHCVSYCAGSQASDCKSLLCRKVYACGMDRRCDIYTDPAEYNQCIRNCAKSSGGKLDKCKNVNMDPILADDFLAKCFKGGIP